MDPAHGDLLVTLSGKSGPQALPALMDVITAHDFVLVDIQQMTVREMMTLSVSLRAKLSSSSEGTSGAFVKDLLLALHPLGMEIQFDIDDGNQLANGNSYDNTDIKSPTKSPRALIAASARAIVTVIAPMQVPASFLADVTDVLAKSDANILSINRTTARGDRFSGYEFIIQLAVGSKSTVKEVDSSLDQVRAELLRLPKFGDISVQKHNLLVRSKRLVVFDLSWTLIQGDAINLLCEAAGVEIPQGHDQDLPSRVSLLKGKPATEVIRKTLSKLEYTDGAVVMCQVLKALGYKLAVISSGAKPLVDAAKYTLGLNYAYGNELIIDDHGFFTGEVESPTIDAERKAELLQMLAMQEKITLDQVVAIGDGPVSSGLLSNAGLSISFDQPTSQGGGHVGGRISGRSLETVLHLMGVSGSDIEAVIQKSSDPIYGLASPGMRFMSM